MSRRLENIKPERVFYYFEEISKIPRCSFHEEKISNYLAEFGKRQGLETIQDESLNVIIRKPGTPGYENSPTVILQGHMDMVCEKEDSYEHDFSKDPLDLKVEGDFLSAEGTTLGADNGIAVAMCLAILESKDISHPPLEVLITSNEESGMDGAKGLDPKNINGKILINIDSEEEGKALVSCAGGERDLVTIPIQWQSLDNKEDYMMYSIKTSGLQGGHSGMEIDKGRGNANKIIARVLAFIKNECDFKLASIEGGSKTNAIPRNGLALVALQREDEESFLREVKKLEGQIQNELKVADPDFELAVEKVKNKVEKVFTDDSFNRVIAALTLIPTGVQSMSMDMEGLVESSNNMGIVKTKDDAVTIESAIRSSHQSLKANISMKIRIIANMVNGKWESHGAYPAWELKEKSDIRNIFKKVYKEQFGKELEIAAIHAGLECGLFAEKFGGGIDMISFGPNMYGVHSPQEKLSISSTQRTYELLSNVLKEIK
ncbi:aminoacyl-histidine dipeptidase [Schnuerera sp. xch1]|uniref:aminoacyl-histidine dipeptidase n=1 Tax=Schnuerera sp. xch1 TaxID=2874283 RepID=UPI001CBD927E|nr:aminoacyl-histidine dipeptidase [Schnuerera sp. xch1]MBZ2174476.1 aminoacyl-histidine dipeptidase [Schnuerera sp. xch1]